MSLTFLAKSSAYSWKMSFCGQVLCQRIVIGPWALATMGKASVAAPAAAAPLRNVRRGASGVVCWLLMRRLLSHCGNEMRNPGREYEAPRAPPGRIAEGF